jgi:hypothetical protein
MTLEAPSRPIPLLALLPCLLAAPAAAGENLAKAYRGRLDHDPSAGPLDWSAGVGDVWALSSFAIEVPGKLEIELGPSTVVLGAHDGPKKERTVVWAAVLPDEPASITSSEPGHGEHATAIFLRFHPAHLGELFPSSAVAGPGDPLQLVWAKRQYMHKINAGWQWDNLPVVPEEDSIVVDVDTVEGKRRRYDVDPRGRDVEVHDYFRDRVLPPLPAGELDAEESAALFREVWGAFDEEYAMFGIKPDVDWDALRERYEPLAERARTPYEAAGVIALLLTHLEDLHVYVRVGDEHVPTYNRFRPLNARWDTVKAALQDVRERNGLTWGRLNHDLGYVNLWNLSDQGMSDAFDAALEDLGDTVGLVVDLRFNGGGDELLGRRIAARFLDRERVYATHRYRDGKDRDDLGPLNERSCEPRGPWRYEAPVVALQGRKTFSSAESLAMMFAQCPDVTTMGERTGGSSANPRRLELKHGIVVNLPRWIDMDADEVPIDVMGFPPDELVEVEGVTAYREADPAFEAAVEHLRKAKNRKPGKR